MRVCLSNLPFFIATLAIAGSCGIMPNIAYSETYHDKEYEDVKQTTDNAPLNYDDLKEKLLKRYTPLVEKIERAENSFISLFESENPITLPKDFSPWWRQQVASPLNKKVNGINVAVDSLFARAVKHSSQIKVFGDLPLIRKTTINEAEGRFDWKFFAEGKLNNFDDPTGDALKTGGPLRYEEKSKDLSYGIIKEFATGANVELKQNIGDMDTNSTYFNPIEQARAGTTLTIRQPLLRRMGFDYNETAINLANIDYSIAGDELRRDLESHLLEISRAYWGLYLERALLAQRIQLAKKSQQFFSTMNGRSNIDAQPVLLAQARSMVNSHTLAAVEAEYAVRNAQSRVLALVNDPELLDGGAAEMVTIQPPSDRLLNISLNEVLETALNNRPEIAQSIKHLQSSAMRLRKTDNELLPDLDLFLQTYVKGLEADYQYGNAYSNQFSEGDPSYVVGLRFEYALGNKEAKARNLRKKIELRQHLHQLDTTVNNILLEAQISYRELMKSYRALTQSYEIMQADKKEIDALTSKKDIMVNRSQPYSLILNQLMSTGERLSLSEERFAKNELEYNYAAYNLYRAMGVLIKQNNISIEEKEGSFKTKEGDRLPRIELSYNSSSASPNTHQ